MEQVVVNAERAPEADDRGHQQVVGQVIREIELVAQVIQSLGFPVLSTREDFQRIRCGLSTEQLVKLETQLRPTALFMNRLMTESGELIPESGRSVDELQLLRRYLSHQRTAVPGDLENFISPGDIIEVYDSEGIQHYRSFNFFELCTYSLEEIFTYEWWHLYERNEFVTRQLVNHFVKFFTGTAKPYLIDLPSHVAREIWSPGRSTIRIKQKALIPVHNLSGELNLIICTFRVLERLENYQGNIQTDLGN
ncbi:MAG: hypothetical protein IT288_05295 [Bdellovibrionales bacterium]|nr:hypothetical protein [Bdellovibrionales bacterium]